MANLLNRQRINVPDFTRLKQCEAVDHIEVFFPKQQQAFTCVKTLNSSTSEHVTDLKIKHLCKQEQHKNDI